MFHGKSELADCLAIVTGHNSAYVRFHGLVVIGMTLYVVVNRTTVARRVRPSVSSAPYGGWEVGLFGRAYSRD